MIKSTNEGTEISGKTPDIINEFFNIAYGITSTNGFEALITLATIDSDFVGIYDGLKPLVKDLAWAFVKNKDCWCKDNVDEEKEDNGD